MEQLINVFKSLSDETRVRILHMLYKHDLCVCELVEVLELSQPKISKHMAKLKTTGLLESARNEQWIYYSLNKDSKFYSLIDTLFKEYKDQEILLNDLNRLNTIESFVCERNV